MERSSIAIVIPAFNEQNTIKDVVTKAGVYGIVIVIDDFSSDSTKQEAESASAIVVSHTSNKGYDKAIDTGFKKAKEIGCSHVVTLDADGQHDPLLLLRLIEKIEEGNDLVLGVRDKLPRVSEKLFSVFSRFFFGIKDPCCGLKAYSMEIYLNYGCFDSYGSIGTELAFYAVKNKHNFSQVEFEVKDRIDSPRFGSLIVANYKIMRALFRAMAKL